LAVQSLEDRGHPTLFDDGSNLKALVEKLTHFDFVAQTLTTLREEPLRSR
jgi:hypothetical protein